MDGRRVDLIPCLDASMWDEGPPTTTPDGSFFSSDETGLGFEGVLVCVLGFVSFLPRTMSGFRTETFLLLQGK